MYSLSGTTSNIHTMSKAKHATNIMLSTESEHFFNVSGLPIISSLARNLDQSLKNFLDIFTCFFS